MIRWAQESDDSLTNRLGILTRKDVRTRWRNVLKVVEALLHGVPWIVVPTMIIWLNTDKHTRNFWLNLILAIGVDLICVGLLKWTVRRARPVHNEMDMRLAAPGDHFSFPSGHTSRAAMLSTIFLVSTTAPLLRLTLIISPLLVGLSRILLGRHYVSDVIGGILLGICEGEFVLHIWYSFL